MRELIANRDINPLLTDLPPQFAAFRQHQVGAVHEAVRCLLEGTRAVLVDAPTGTGKTLVAEAVRRILKVRAAYICHNKDLQRQFDREFPYARLLMGRNNYPTLRYASSFHPGEWLGHISCEDCTWTSKQPSCALCPNKQICPYEIAKTEAIRSPLPILNSSYFLTEANGPHKFSGRKLVIADECDTLEDALMGWVSVEVSEKRMKQYHWDAPKITVEEDWLRWCTEKGEEVGKLLVPFRQLQTLDMRQAREVKYLSGLEENLARIVHDLEGGSSSWVYTGDRESVSFKPSRVVQHGEEALWSHGKQWLLMSASIISAEEMMYSLGFREGDYRVVSVPSTFPIKNRLVHIRPLADMTYKAQGKDDGLLIGGLRRILFEYPNDRVVLHTASYALTDKIVRRLRSLFPNRPIFCYTSANSRGAAIDSYKATKNAVLLGPSLDRGLDLPDDLCRIQVICKVPFPNLKDKVVNARYHGGAEGKTWYTVKTVRSIVQMTGRAVRSEKDWATTYILDKAFVDQLWYRGGQHLFPAWWQEAMVWERV